MTIASLLLPLALTWADVDPVAAALPGLAVVVSVATLVLASYWNLGNRIDANARESREQAAADRQAMADRLDAVNGRVDQAVQP